MVDVERLRIRWTLLDAALRVTERFGAIGGRPLAASITLAAFMSLFPLLLVVIAVVGFWSSSDAGFAARLVDDLGLRGSAADAVRDAIDAAERSRRAATVVGIAGLLWTGLGLVGSIQAALNAVWQASSRGLLDRLLALRWLVGAGTLFLGTVAIGPALLILRRSALPVTMALGLVVTTALFVWIYSSLGNKNVPLRAHLPGALLVAAGVEVFKAIGSVWLPHVVAASSGLYGSLGTMFAVLACLLLCSRLIVYGAVLNVVRFEARAGTVTVEIEVPHIEGETPLTTTRGGAVDEQAEPDRDD